MMTYLEYVAKRTGIKKEFIRTIFRHLENLEGRDNNSVTVKDMASLCSESTNGGLRG